jgi:AraC-like DNA-binding protein
VLYAAFEHVADRHELVFAEADARRRSGRRAKALLLDPNLSLSAVALLVGFSSHSAFGAAFRRETGWTPAAWRRTRLS